MAGAAASVPAVSQGGAGVRAQQTPGIRGFDHVSLPLTDTDAMLSFYRALGLTVNKGPRICSVHFGDQKLNFHRPEFWQDPRFTARAPAAQPPCGDFCVVWEGSSESLMALFERVGAEVELGPVEQPGGRGSGTVIGTSRYIRDPDGNLLEFMIYS